MNLRTRPVRAALAVGTAVVAATSTFVALTAGTAAADEPGRCRENVNVREYPDPLSRIVALCEAGTQVTLGEERVGWVRVAELGGWALKDYVTATGPSRSARADSDSADSDSTGDTSDGDTSDGDTSDGDTSDGPDVAEAGSVDGLVRLVG